MILSLKQLEALTHDGTLDVSYYKQYVALAKGSSVLDVADAPYAFRGDLMELVEIHPQIVADSKEIDAAADEAVRAKNEQEAIQRFDFWLKGDGKRRLQRVPYNSEKVIEAIQKTGRPVTAALVDECIRKLDHLLFWEELAQITPPPPPAQPAPVVRTLSSGDPELNIDASESEMRRASKEQLQDLDRRRNPNRKAPTYGFEVMPAEITRKAIINAPLALIKTWERRFGRDAIDARLQGRG
jgi:hypothetical protein